MFIYGMHFATKGKCDFKDLIVLWKCNDVSLLFEGWKS